MVTIVMDFSKMLHNNLHTAFIVAILLSACTTSVLGTNQQYFDGHGLSALNADLIENPVNGLSYDFVGPQYPQRKLEPPCEEYLKEYADLASKFIKCALEHARPLNFCETCVSEYVQAKDVFDFLMEGKGHDQHGRQCRDVILNADRIQIVSRTDKYIGSIWGSSNCINCYDLYHNINGTVEAKLNNDTVEFLGLLNETRTCFSEFMNGTEILPFNTTGNASACEVCGDIYSKLNTQYHYMDKKFNKEICMDVVDSMNYTRLMWSQEFGCTQFRHKSYIVGVVSAILAIVAFSFYCGACLFAGESKRKPLEPQTRLRTDAIGINDGATPSCSTEQPSLDD